MTNTLREEKPDFILLNEVGKVPKNLLKNTNFNIINNGKTAIIYKESYSCVKALEYLNDEYNTICSVNSTSLKIILYSAYIPPDGNKKKT